MFNSLRIRFISGLAFGILVVAGLGVYADIPKLAQALAGFPLAYLPAIVALTLLNYLLRFAKWHFLLWRIGVRGLPVVDSMMMFFSGLSMVLTPGKVGEWLKSYLLQEVHGTPFARSAPIIVAERLTDGLAMVLLAAGGLVVFQTGWQVMVLVVALAAFIILTVQVRPLALGFLSIAERLPVVSGFAHHLESMYESSRTIFSPGNLIVGVAIGVISWGGECVAYYLVLSGLGQEPNLLLLVQATFILAAASLGGSIFLMPGGLGVAEGGITGLSQVLLGMPKELAATGALIIRLSTLWFGVAVGLLFLAIMTKRMDSVRSLRTAAGARVANDT